jgi:hypothetical protein
LHGKYCHACGQQKLEPNERTVKYLVAQFLGSAFFIENNFLRNLWLVLTKPGKIAKDYIDGKRKRHMPPFSLFLLINFFFFIYNPLTDYKLPLQDQARQPVYGPLAEKMINQKLQAENITFDAYALEYWDWSVTLAKTLIILNAPITAVFLMIWFWKRRMFFIDHFIYSLYLYAFVLLYSIIHFLIFYKFLSLDVRWIHAVFFSVIILYTFLSAKRFYTSPSRLVPFTNLLALIPILVLTHFIYRFLLFLTTYAVT